MRLTHEEFIEEMRKSGIIINSITRKYVHLYESIFQFPPGVPVFRAEEIMHKKFFVNYLGREVSPYEALMEGNKIAAILSLRANQPLGLKQAKDFIEFNYDKICQLKKRS